MAQQTFLVFCFTMTLCVYTFNTSGTSSPKKTFFLQEYLRQASVHIIRLQELDVGQIKIYNYTVYRNNMTQDQKTIDLAIRNDLIVEEIFHHPSARISYVNIYDIYVVCTYLPTGSHHIQQLKPL